MSEKLTEKDLEQIFIASRYKKKNPIWVFLKVLLTFVLVFCAVFYALNFSAYNQKIKYWYRDEFGRQNKPLSTIVLGPSDINQVEDPQIPQIPENSIYLERIDVTAPITFRVENEAKVVSDNLRNGVIQISDTALPGEPGNVFITGHSSNYPWISSKYNSVFALLDKEVVGDLIMIRFNEINYIYQIEEKFVVSPSEVGVMDAYAEYPTLTLMTCTPVGTNLNRLIVRAKQILPIPATKPTQPVNTGGGTLPGGVR